MRGRLNAGGFRENEEVAVSVESRRRQGLISGGVQLATTVLD